MLRAMIMGSAGFPVADLGDSIEKSVRFRGVSGQKLVGSSAIAVDDTYTLSFWYKHTHNTTRYRGSIFTNNGGTPYLSFNASNGTYSGIEVYNGSAFVLYPPGSVGSFRQLRDPSAWFHCVIAQVNSTSFTIYINGEQAFTSSSQCDWSNFALGGHTTSQYICDGYIAQLYHIDGSALTPTSFGRTNEDGVWVPKNYTGTYGTNGFHLDFADSSNPGNDVSGNNNDFTASGFDTGDVALYTGNEAGSTSTYQSNSANRTQTLSNEGSTFDGVTAGGTQVSGGGGGYWYLENKSFSNLTGLRLLWGNASQVADIRLNGTTVGWSTSGNYTVVDTDDIPATVTEIAARRDRDNTQVLQVEVNTGSGFVALLDNFDNDVDYNDTPTSNYATLNSLDNHGGTTSFPTLSEANLRNADTSISGLSGSTIHFGDENKEYYFEFMYTGSSASSTAPGLRTAQSGNHSGRNDNVSYYYRSDGNIVRGEQWNTDNTAEATGATWAAGDILGTAFNPSNNRLRFFKNGTEECDITISPTEPLQFGVYNDGVSGIQVNYGQRNFIHAPTGITALQTNNLPEPTIKNGKEHFDVVTYTGNASGGTGSQNISLEFQPDLVWIKHRTSGYNHNWFDSIRGTSVRLRSNMNNGDDSMTNGVTAFNSDGFTVGGNAGVNDNNNSYVAWCWKAGGTAVSNTDGTITSSVSANTDAGFSIITYTGNGGGNAATVGHGLTEAPEMLIAKRTDSSQSWAVYHKDVGNDRRLSLHNSDAQTSTGANYWNNTSPTNSVFSIGSNINPNPAGDYVVYAWHSVEGFSKFGSYTGNANSNGPFVYLGFRPAFVILKCITFSGLAWLMYDSARVTSNPIETRLVANTTNAEGTYSNQAVDFLSNGFKIRGNDSDPNKSGETYIYMAFAENPFGGENAPPVTAR